MYIKGMVIILLVISCCLVEIANSGPNLHSSECYQSINRALKRIPNPEYDPRKYIQGAKDELGRVQLNPSHYNTRYPECLRDFIKLEIIFNHRECTFEEYEQILEPVTRETHGHRYVSRPNKMTPVNLVVNRVCYLRATECIPNWPDKFNHIYNEVMSSYVKKYAEFMDWSWLQPPGCSNRQFMRNLIDYKFLYLDEKIVRNAYEHVERHSRTDQERCDFTQMIEKYLKDPCSRYTNTIGRLVLTQAKFDAQMFPDYDGYIIGDDSRDSPMLPFYLAMAHNEACQAVFDPDFDSEVWNLWLSVEKSNNSECYRTFLKIPSSSYTGSSK